MTQLREFSVKANLRKQVKLRSSGRNQKLPLIYAGLTRKHSR